MAVALRSSLAAALLFAVAAAALLALASADGYIADRDLPSWRIVNASPKSVKANFKSGSHSFTLESIRTPGKIYDMDAAVPKTMVEAADKARAKLGEKAGAKAGGKLKPDSTVKMPAGLPDKTPVLHSDTVSLSLSSDTGIVFASIEGDVPEEWKSKLRHMSTTRLSKAVASEMKTRFAEAVASLKQGDLGREVALATGMFDQLVSAVDKSDGGGKKPTDNIADDASQILKHGVQAMKTGGRKLVDTLSNPVGREVAAFAFREKRETQKVGAFPVRYNVHLYTGKAFDVAGDHSATVVERRNDEDGSFLSSVVFCNHGRCPTDKGMSFKCTHRGGTMSSDDAQPGDWMCRGSYFPVWCTGFLGLGGYGFHNCNGDATFQFAVADNPGNPPSNGFGMCMGLCPATSPAC